MKLNGVDKTLTREEALRLHREMWTAMQKTLGDDPEPRFREGFKRDWMCKHGYDDVANDCFLCEYSCDGRLTHCSDCPIDWSPLCAEGLDFCTSMYRFECRNGGYAVYTNATISEILALPERRTK